MQTAIYGLAATAAALALAGDRKRALRLLATTIGLVAIGVVAAGIYVRSDHFSRAVRPQCQRADVAFLRGLVRRALTIVEAAGLGRRLSVYGAAAF